jgi:hypothetical protein
VAVSARDWAARLGRAGRATGGAVGGWVRRHWKGIGLTVLGIAVLAVVLDRALDEPLRRRVERNVNARLQGYSVQLGGLDFHLIGFSLDLHDLVVRQDANPEPPVARIGRLAASIHWRVLLTSGRLVADFALDRPAFYVNLQQLRAENRDQVPVDQRGWQDALREIYPFEINVLRIRDGELVYIDADPSRPLRLSDVQLVARNIRNIESRDRTYPSDLRVQATVFDRGRLLLEGHADFLAEPHAGVQADVTIENLGLDYFKPVAGRYNLQISAGTMFARGAIEYAPSIQTVHLRELRVDGLQADYVTSKRTAPKEERTREQVAEKAEEVSNAPGVVLRIDHATVHARSIGFVNESANPGYRVFLDQVELELRNLSNHFEEGEATAALTGQFMGSGRTVARATFRPEEHGPDFDLSVRIEDTKMRALNDVLRAYGKFDVVSGLFSFYSELAVKGGRIDGYVKPLFRDLDVYDARQDKEKGLFRKLYEGLVGGISKLLENRPREEVATKAEVTGPVKDPKASTWEILVRLIQNAFFQAILPGFDQELRRGRG